MRGYRKEVLIVPGRSKDDVQKRQILLGKKNQQTTNAKIDIPNSKKQS